VSGASLELDALLAATGIAREFGDISGEAMSCRIGRIIDPINRVIPGFSLTCS